MTTATATASTLREGDLVLYNGRPARVSNPTPCSPQGACCEARVDAIDGSFSGAWAAAGSLVLVRPGDLKVGDRVRLVHQDGRTHDAEVTRAYGQAYGGAFRIDTGVSFSPRWAAMDTSLIASSQVDDGRVRITRAEPEPTDPEPTVSRPLQAGDRVRLLRSIGGQHGTTGSTGTLEARPGSTDLAFRADGGTGGAYGNGLYSLELYGTRTLESTVELIEPATAADLVTEDRGDLAEAVQRAERAENALQAFRDQVRQAVIDEAAEQGWCDRTDSWLEELGLEPREPESNDYTAYVDVNVTVRVTVPCSGPDDETAAEYIDSDMVESALTSGAYSLGDMTIEDWSVDYLDAD